MPRGKHSGHVRGSRHPRWNEGRIASEHGYTKIRVGIEHPLADPNGYAYEHLLVLAAAGITVAPGQVAHHRNGDKQDNRIENLVLLARGEHNAYHNAERERDALGCFLPKSGGRLLDGREWNEMPQ